MKTIITGAAGFVGSNLMNRLIQMGEDVEGIDNLSFGYKKNLDPKAILWTEDFAKMPDEFWSKYDMLVHLATANIIFAMGNEVKTFETNSLNTINLFQKFRNPYKRIIYTSTTSIYGNADTIPTGEYAPHKCYNAYDTSKYIAELYLKDYTNYTTLRLSNVYGPNQRPESQYAGVIGKMMGKLLKQEPIEVYGDGTDTRDYTYVDDVVDAIIAAMQQEPKKQEINIASGRETGSNELVLSVLAACKEEESISIGKATFDGKIKYVAPRKIDIIKRRCLNIERANYMLGWQPKTSLEEGLEKTYEWIKNEIL